MAAFEDHFSRRAAEYARHRPLYPPELFAWLASVAPARRLAWDCGTGIGLAALGLVAHFERVVATDASEEQLGLAVPHERIEYRAGRAEDVRLDPGSVDLVTVAAAIHWFEFDAFYDAVRRVAAADAVIAAWTYHLSVIDPALDAVLERYAFDTLAAHWPERFRYVDQHYGTLPFPFYALPHPPFEMRAEWDLERLAGFIASWSGAMRYRQATGRNPVDAIRPALARAWGDPARVRTIRWPLYLRAGRVR
jgi:hypothetical protein